jgi:hypothetical protein
MAGAFANGGVLQIEIVSAASRGMGRKILILHLQTPLQVIDS